MNMEREARLFENWRRTKIERTDNFEDEPIYMHPRTALLWRGWLERARLDPTPHKELAKEKQA